MKKTNLLPIVTPNSLSILDLVLYIQANDRNGIFAEIYNEYKLVALVTDAVNRNTIYYARDDINNELYGVVIGEPDYNTRTMFIPIIVTTNKLTLLLFLAKFRHDFPGWILEGYRHKVLYKDWDLERIEQLYNKLLNKAKLWEANQA